MTTEPEYTKPAEEDVAEMLRRGWQQISDFRWEKAQTAHAGDKCIVVQIKPDGRWRAEYEYGGLWVTSKSFVDILKAAATSQFLYDFAPLEAPRN